jgi:chromate transporter
MKFLVLYFLFLKGTVTSFAGLASLPVIRDELVVKRHMLTDDDLNASVVVTRTTPGPVGLYVVSVGYFAAGLVGATAGWLAMSTPALMIILLVSYFGRRAEHPRIRGMLQSVVMASAALLVVAAVPLARDAITSTFALVLAVVCLLVLFSKKVDPLLVIGGASSVSLVGSLLGAIHGPP